MNLDTGPDSIIESELLLFHSKVKEEIPPPHESPERRGHTSYKVPAAAFFMYSESKINCMFPLFP